MEQKKTIRPPELQVRVYKRRWLILLVFIVYSIACLNQWIQYSIIGNIISRYYNVSALAVDWTSLNFMASYCVFIIPAMYMVEKYGIRQSITLGAVLLTIGSWIKVASVQQDRFAIGFVGHFIVGASQVFILSLPPKVAAVWFPPEQISTACALAFIGIQLGVAIGFIQSPSMVRNHDSLASIGYDLKRLFYTVAALSTLSLLLILIFLKEAPTCPPSAAEARRLLTQRPAFLGSLKRILISRPFWLLTIASGFNQGMYNTLSTLLNQILLRIFPGEEVFAGRIGLVIILVGTFGCFLCGLVLDKTHAFKPMCQVTNLSMAAAIVALSTSIWSASHLAVYVASAVLGLAIGMSIIASLELSLELLYPEAETSISGIIIISWQVFGIILTMIYSWILTVYGPFWADGSACALILAGSVIFHLIPADYRRQKFLAESHHEFLNRIEIIKSESNPL